MPPAIERSLQPTRVSRCRCALLLCVGAAALARAEAPGRAVAAAPSAQRSGIGGRAAPFPARMLLPSCGDGVLDADEACEASYGNWSAQGCDATRCVALPGWSCAGGACGCANAAGTLALPAANCSAQACPYAPRCPGDGAGCTPGAEGAGCALCADGFARSKRTQGCRACPHGVPWMLIAAVLGLLLVLLVVGPFLARLASPVVAAQLRLLIIYLQHLALVADARLPWPPATSAAFAPLRGLTRGADVASPECFFPGKWSYQRHIELLASAAGALAAAVAIALTGYTLLQRRVLLRDDASDAAHATQVALVESYARRRNALRQFYSIYAQICYVMLVSVLLDAWDCPAVGAGGVRLLRTDPATACGSPAFLRFRVAATSALALFAAAVPLGIAALLSSLRREALRGCALLRPAWRGLAYPATRAAWGGFYQMYRFDGWHELREPDPEDEPSAGPTQGAEAAAAAACASGTVPASPGQDGVRLLEDADVAASPRSPATPACFRGSPGSVGDSMADSPGSPRAAGPRFAALRRGPGAALRRALRRASRVAAPYFDCVYYAQRLLLLAAGHAFPSVAAAAAGQAAVFAAGAALVAALAPLQRLDVRLPLRCWLPLRLTRAPADASGQASGWRRAPFGLGYFYSSHVMVFDALNATAVAANLVPMLTIVAAVSARGAAAPAMGFFVLGLNALMLLATVAIWLAGVAAFREQAAELAALREACCAAARAGRTAATSTAVVVLLPDSAAAASDEHPLAPAAAPLRRRARRSSTTDGADAEAPAEAGAGDAAEGDSYDLPLEPDAGGAAAGPGSPSKVLRISVPEWLAEMESSPRNSLSPHRKSVAGLARLSAALSPSGRRSSAASARRSSVAAVAMGALGARLPRGAALLRVASALGGEEDDVEAADDVAEAAAAPVRGSESSDGSEGLAGQARAGGPKLRRMGTLARLRAWASAASPDALAGVHAGADTEATLVAAGAMFALMRARQQHTRALALARAAEFVTALALVRLHHRRVAAKRAGAAGGARLAAVEAEMRALERVFAEQGFEAAMARRGAERAEQQHRQGDAPGVGARAALATALLLLAACVAALGALARRVLPNADVVAVQA